MDILILGFWLVLSLAGIGLGFYIRSRVLGTLPAIALLLSGIMILTTGIDVQNGLNTTTTWGYQNVSLPRFWEENQSSIVPLVNGTELVYAIGGSNSSWNENATVSLAQNQSVVAVNNYQNVNNAWTLFLGFIMSIFALLVVLAGFE